MIKIGFKNYNNILDTDYSGYKTILDLICRFAHKDVVIESSNLNSSDLLICRPLSNSNEFRNKCRLSMWETNRISRGHFFDFNKHEVIFVPNQFNANVFCASGLNNNIEIFDPFISDDFSQKPFKNRDKLVFGICFSTTSLNRNDINTAINCFTKAFESKSDVELWIKCVNYEHNKVVDERIKFVSNSMNSIDLLDWYENIDILLCCSHGEGIGLMNLEAMATGRPLLTHTFSGMQSYVNSYNSFIYEYKLDGPNYSFYAGHGKWAYIIEESLIEKMKYIYNNKYDIYNKSVHAISDVSIYKSSISIPKFLNRIKKYV